MGTNILEIGNTVMKFNEAYHMVKVNILPSTLLWKVSGIKALLLRVNLSITNTSMMVNL